MRPISIKLAEEQITEIDAEAEERDLTRSQYLRRIIDARHESEERPEDQTAAIARVEERLDRVEGITETVAGLSDRVRELEERLDHQDAGTLPTEITSQQSVSSESSENAERAALVEREEQTSPSIETEPDPLLGERETETGIDAVLTDWRPGRSREKREQQRAAGRAVLEWLRDQEVATAAEFKETVEPEHPVSQQSPATWWKKSGREALNRAQDAGLVEFVDGRKEWVWLGE